MNHDTNMTKNLNSFCSEYFYCTTCLRQDHKIVKGTVRFDSLVQCEDHAINASIILSQVVNAIYEGSKGNVKVINL